MTEQLDLNKSSVLTNQNDLCNESHPYIESRNVHGPTGGSWNPKTFDNIKKQTSMQAGKTEIRQQMSEDHYNDPLAEPALAQGIDEIESVKIDKNLLKSQQFVLAPDHRYRNVPEFQQTSDLREEQKEEMMDEVPTGIKGASYKVDVILNRPETGMAQQYNATSAKVLEQMHIRLDNNSCLNQSLGQANSVFEASMLML